MVLLGVTSAVLLVAWGVLTAASGGGADPVFWILAAAFLVYLAWDIRRHVVSMRTRTAARERRGP